MWSRLQIVRAGKREMQERMVWKGRGGLPHKLVTHQLRQYDQYEFRMGSMLTEGKAVPGLYHRWWILGLGNPEALPKAHQVMLR